MTSPYTSDLARHRDLLLRAARSVADNLLSQDPPWTDAGSFELDMVYGIYKKRRFLRGDQIATLLLNTQDGNVTLSVTDWIKDW